MKRTYRVRFLPDDVEVAVEERETLLTAAMRAGVYLNASCGGEGTCGKCKVILESGSVEAERGTHISEQEFAEGVRQACQSAVVSDVVVRVPVEMQLDRAVLGERRRGVHAGRTILEHELEQLATGWGFNPALRKLHVSLPAPTKEDNVSDVSRLLRELKRKHKIDNISVDFRVVRTLPQDLRAADWDVTATLVMTRTQPQLADFQLRGSRKPKLINVEAGDTVDEHYSVVVDIGTTTICAQLLDLKAGKVLAMASDYNRQIRYGDDVITRIEYCRKKGGLEQLQKEVVGTVNDLIDTLLEEAGVLRERISHVAAAGNSTMTHILLGIDPKYLRESPYTPAANFLPPVRAIHLGMNVGGHVHLYTFPMVASYVGGDIVSGILGSGVYQRSRISLYIDLGTNGEIVIGNCDWLVTASCSAGPAFEGGGIEHGMRAARGAIEQIQINPTTCEPMIITVGNARPRGICGSGLINIVAELLETGIIGQNGKFNPEARCSSNRVREVEGAYEYVICWAQESQTGKDIVITEPDIDNLVRAKAAMYAGCKVLLESVGLTPDGIDEVIIAGAFGDYIDLDSAMTIGLLPELPAEKFVFIGNGSLLGARLVSFSNEMLDDGERIARMMTNFELSENVSFMDEYTAALFLPHTDVDAFPSVQERLGLLRGRCGSEEVINR
jgi:uncharacterized 2Fe-2S/4Fe-4S cluster protein (DUF4445 family)